MSQPHGIRLRLAGAVVGGALATLAAAVSHWLDVYWWQLGTAPLGLIGIGVGLLVGFVAALDAVMTRRPVVLAVVLAAKAALVGLTVIWAATYSGAFGGGGSADDSFAGLLTFVAFGFPGALAYGLPVTTPIALIGVTVLRLWVRRPRAGQLTIAAIVLVGALASVVAIVVPAPRLTFAEEDLLAPVRLEWTVANHSSEGLAVHILTRTGEGSTSGSIAGAPPCFTTTGREGVGEGWFIGLGRSGRETTTPPGVVSAADAPGANPRVWITIARDGTVTSEAGRGAPPPEALAVDHCMEEGSQ